MAISQNRFIVVDTTYVKSAEYGKRSFCGRCFTTNAKAPFGKVVEVFDADGAKQFFGIDSDEYRFADKYFSFQTNQGRSPYKLSFARWTPVNINGWIKATKDCVNWNSLHGYSDYADYILEFNTTKVQIVINLSDVKNCTCLSNPNDPLSLVSIINSKLSGSSIPEYFRNATASIESGKLQISLPSGKIGDVENHEILLPCTGGRIADDLGLTKESGVVVSNFAIGEDTLAAVSRVNSENDDFGSFMFFDWMSSFGAEVLPYQRISRILKIAEWNASQNYKYMFVEALPDSWDSNGTYENTVHIQDEISSDFPGTAICAFRNSGSGVDMNGYRYEEFLPMAILASTDFETKEATQNYMFQNCEKADITFDGSYVESIEKELTAKNINIYGEVQEIGAKRAFLMPGKMLNGDDMSVYACEMYLKEAISTWLINFFLKNEIVRATQSDMTRIAIEIDNIVLAAKENGIVNNGFVLDSTQRLYVNNVAGSEKAYLEIEKDGYCLSVFPSLEKNKPIVKYVLIYNKHGQIRKIEGQHVILV